MQFQSAWLNLQHSQWGTPSSPQSGKQQGLQCRTKLWSGWRTTKPLQQCAQKETYKTKQRQVQTQRAQISVFFFSFFTKSLSLLIERRLVFLIGNEGGKWWGNAIKTTAKAHVLTTRWIWWSRGQTPFGPLQVFSSLAFECLPKESYAESLAASLSVVLLDHLRGGT